MFMIKESVDRNKIRRARSVQQNGNTKQEPSYSKNGSEPQIISSDGDLYENTNLIGQQGQLRQKHQMTNASHANGIQPPKAFGNTNEELDSMTESIFGKENHTKSSGSPPHIKARATKLG